MFCSSEGDFQRLKASLPASYGMENAGPRQANKVTRLTRANQAIAREAIYAEIREQELGDINFRHLATGATDKESHLNDPELGAFLAQTAAQQLSPEHQDVQIIVSDGLSAEAVHHNIPQLLPILRDGLQGRGYSLGQPILAPYGRVKLAESIGELVQPKVLVILIGERPGGDALASRSLSAYLFYRLPDQASRRLAADFSGNDDIRYEYTVISNIYQGGLPPLEAGAVVVEKISQILQYQAAGNRLEYLRQH
ncbi:MAG: ethanolamine ammonia-lyase light chain EutC [Enterobacteriaceae bacterium]